jgi:hypothetical protein
MSKSGRYTYTDLKTGRTFVVEPIGDSHETWGDVDPVTKKMTGSYGEKYPGSIDKSESIITEENGFKNIMTIGPGISPQSYIEEFIKNNP